MTSGTLKRGGVTTGSLTPIEVLVSTDQARPAAAELAEVDGIQRAVVSGDQASNRAVIQGMARTGRLATCAALILCLAFVALSSGPITDIKVMATGLGLGIRLDATIVRALLVLSLVSLFGAWNWYLPERLARILRVRPSHATTEPPVPGQAPVGLRLGQQASRRCWLPLQKGPTP